MAWQRHLCACQQTFAADRHSSTANSETTISNNHAYGFMTQMIKLDTAVLNLGRVLSRTLPSQTPLILALIIYFGSTSRRRYNNHQHYIRIKTGLVHASTRQDGIRRTSIMKQTTMSWEHSRAWITTKPFGELWALYRNLSGDLGCMSAAMCGPDSATS